LRSWRTEREEAEVFLPLIRRTTLQPRVTSPAFAPTVSAASQVTRSREVS
jgi:hypothetical protein